MKNIGVFLSENFQFLEMKFSIYLNRRVFVTVTLLESVCVPLKKLWILWNISTKREYPDKTARDPSITKTRLFKYIENFTTKN